MLYRNFGCTTVKAAYHQTIKCKSPSMPTKISHYIYVRLLLYYNIILTYLIYLLVVESVDQSGECNGISWPLCFVKVVSEVENQAKSDFVCPQAISKVIA